METEHCEDALQNSISTPEQLFKRFGNPHVLDDLIRLRAADEAQQPILAHPSFENDPASYEYFTGRDLDAMIDQAARVLINQGFRPVSFVSKKLSELYSCSRIISYRMIINLSWRCSRLQI